MSWSFPIAKLGGTVIRVHVTFLLFLLWIAVAHYVRGGAPAATQGVGFIVALFACVLLHELGHVFAARRYGVQTPDVTLLPIGGVARLERIPEEPTQELVIAIAGPLVNVVIAAAIIIGLHGLMPLQSYEVQNPGASLFSRLAWANVFLVVFNLIPAFPMDGGRVLRALLAYRLGHARATQIAAAVGQGLAFLFGILGLFGNPLLLFIALFVYLGATAEAHAAQMRQVSRGLIVADAMITRFESLSPASRIDDAVQCLIRTTQHEFPVVDGSGRLRGVLTRDAMIRALRSGGPDVPVTDAMQRDIPVIGQRQSLDQALRQLQQGGFPALGVADSTGRLVGLLTAENIGEMMMVQAAQPRPPPRNPWVQEQP